MPTATSPVRIAQQVGERFATALVSAGELFGDLIMFHDEILPEIGVRLMQNPNSYLRDYTIQYFQAVNHQIFELTDRPICACFPWLRAQTGSGTASLVDDPHVLSNQFNHMARTLNEFWVTVRKSTWLIIDFIDDVRENLLELGFSDQELQLPANRQRPTMGPRTLLLMLITNIQFQALVPEDPTASELPAFLGTY